MVPPLFICRQYSRLGDSLAFSEEAALGEENEVAPVLRDEYLGEVALQPHQRFITVLLTLN